MLLKSSLLKKGRAKFKILNLSVLVPFLLSLNSQAYAKGYFDSGFLEIDNLSGEDVDLSVFEKGNQPEGTYRVDIWLNQELLDTKDIAFSKQSADGNLEPCITRDDLKSYGVDDQWLATLTDGDQCQNLKALKYVSYRFDFAMQRLELSIPQAMLKRNSKDYINPSLWDQGINALILDYSLSGTSMTQNSDNIYVNARPGFNFGPWRLRNYSIWNRTGKKSSDWKSITTTLQRDSETIHGSIKAGDGYSTSEFFDSVPFRGLQVTSDEDMLPNSQRGYAPVVRGIARSNADVIIRQNGYTIYRTAVPPGPFEINDMYPTGGNGDLEVSVKEADGRVQQFNVPYATLPILQREGHLKYSFSGGKYHADARKHVPFMQMVGIYGLPFNTTMIGGIQSGGNIYRAGGLGLGVNLGQAGAFTSDMLLSRAVLKDGEVSGGRSVRFRYNKNMTRTGTNVAIAGYRYSSKGYYSLQDLMTEHSLINPDTRIGRRRHRFEVTLNQRLWENAGSISLGLVREIYRDGMEGMTSLTSGYYTNWKGVSASINYSYNQTKLKGQNSNNNNQILSLNISIPFSNWSADSYTYANTNMTSQKNGQTSYNVGLDGSLLDGNVLSWSVQQGLDERFHVTSQRFGGNYNGMLAKAGVSYSSQSHQQRINYNLAGSVLIHDAGITLSQPIGETAALVKTGGANGVKIQNRSGLYTDRFGFAVVPYLMPYHENKVSLDSASLPDNVELSTPSKVVVPTRGAIVLSDFETYVGLRALLTLKKDDGEFVPFGAIVTGNKDSHVSGGIVDENGQVYLSGLPVKGEVVARWGTDENKICTAKFDSNSIKVKSGLAILTAHCKKTKDIVK